MILTCPNCDAKFNIKDGALGTDGRKVKCSKCDHRWHAMPEGAAPEAPPPPPPPEPEPEPAPAEEPAAEDPFAGFDNEPADGAPPEPVEDDAEQADPGEPDSIPPQPEDDTVNIDAPPIPPESHFQPRQQEEPKGGWIGWIIFAVVLISVIGALIVFRSALVQIYPPIGNVYALVGLGPAIPGEGLTLPTPKSTPRKEGDSFVLDVAGTIENNTSSAIELPKLKGTLLDSKGNPTHSWEFDAGAPMIMAGEKISYKTMVKDPPKGSVQLTITFTRGGGK